MATDLILGTAGHIDHGKTALVRALTGTDTDRLPEEQRRGITIELGFARLELGSYRLGIVDVPGHERFVRQMLAGATGMDLAMLVVAADDSVKPQTREHVDVLRMLQIASGVIVLTKCDLADPEWTDLVEAEVRELVEGSFLEQAPLVRTSALTGLGIDRLKTALAAAAARAAAAIPPASIAAPFRMAIDRSFTVAGYGSVATGSVVSGQAHVGDELEVQPGHITVRVRGLQNHDQTVDRVLRGQRAAINLAGIHHGQIRRGQEVATPGHLVPSHLITTDLQLLAEAPRPLKHRDHVRVHVGTAEVLATVSLLDTSPIRPGQTGLTQLFLREPVATVWRQPFVLRCESPVSTIGGGHVLAPAAEKIRRVTREQRELLETLKGADELARAAAALYFQGLRPWSDQDLARLAGARDAQQIAASLRENGDVVPLVVSPRRTARLERQVLQHWQNRLCQALALLHAAHPLRSMVDRSQLLNRFHYLQDPPLLEAILVTLQEAGRIRQTAAEIALATHQPQLSPKQQQVLAQIVERFRAAPFRPPAIADCYDLLPRQEKEIGKLVQLAVADGQIVHISQELFLHRDAEQQLQQRVRESLADGEGLTLSAIRELLGTTRKYAVPFCEYLDRIGLTQRKGDLRVLA